MRVMIAAMSVHIADAESAQENRLIYRIVKESPSLHGFTAEYRASYEQRLTARVGVHLGRDSHDIDITVAGAILNASRLVVMHCLTDAAAEGAPPEHMYHLVDQALPAFRMLAAR